MVNKSFEDGQDFMMGNDHHLMKGMFQTVPAAKDRPKTGALAKRPFSHLEAKVVGSSGQNQTIKSELYLLHHILLRRPGEESSTLLYAHDSDQFNICISY